MCYTEHNLQVTKYIILSMKYRKHRHQIQWPNDWIEINDIKPFLIKLILQISLLTKKIQTKQIICKMIRICQQHYIVSVESLKMLQRLNLFLGTTMLAPLPYCSIVQQFFILAYHKPQYTRPSGLPGLTYQLLFHPAAWSWSPNMKLRKRSFIR